MALVEAGAASRLALHSCITAVAFPHSERSLRSSPLGRRPPARYFYPAFGALDNSSVCFPALQAIHIQ